MNYKKLAKQDLGGKIWFMPTDTIPGLSCLVRDDRALEKIRELKKRDHNKPFVVLCTGLEQINDLGITILDSHLYLLDKVWPGPVTAILPLRDDILSHIRGDQYSVAVRVPSDKKLIKFLSQVGPVVSTSCNISGQPAIVDHKEAEQTFGEQIDYYLNTKDAEATASTIIKIIR